MEILPEIWFWKEAGCRRNSSSLVGRKKVNIKLVKRRKALKSTGFIIAQHGTMLDGIPEVFRNWEQKARTSKNQWKWQRGIFFSKKCVDLATAEPFDPF